MTAFFYQPNWSQLEHILRVIFVAHLHEEVIYTLKKFMTFFPDYAVMLSAVSHNICLQKVAERTTQEWTAITPPKGVCEKMTQPSVFYSYLFLLCFMLLRWGKSQ